MLTNQFNGTVDDLFNKHSEANHLAIIQLRKVFLEAGFKVVKKIRRESTLRVYPKKFYDGPLLNPRFSRRVNDSEQKEDILKIDMFYNTSLPHAHFQSFKSTPKCEFVKVVSPDDSSPLIGYFTIPIRLISHLSNFEIDFDSLRFPLRKIHHFLVDEPIESDVDFASSEEAFQTWVGAGFGDPFENKLVESAAIQQVETEYARNGWDVRSVEDERCGFDLVCTKDTETQHVEVKGIRSTEQSFIITANEVNKARHDELFVLFVVTEALSKSPKLTQFTGKDFLNRFDLSAISFRAALRQ